MYVGGHGGSGHMILCFARSASAHPSLPLSRLVSTSGLSPAASLTLRLFGEAPSTISSPFFRFFLCTSLLIEGATGSRSSLP